MENVKPWIITTISQHLERVLSWRAVGDNLFQHHHDFAGELRFEDDGGTLRLSPTRTGQVTVISKVSEVRDI